VADEAEQPVELDEAALADKKRRKEEKKRLAAAAAAAAASPAGQSPGLRRSPRLVSSSKVDPGLDAFSLEAPALKASKLASAAAPVAAAKSLVPTGPVEVIAPAAYRKKHEITLEGNDLANLPLFQRFEDAPFPAPLQKTLSTAGFSAPSAIQAQCWPVAFAQRDCLAIAKTGSGKTIGFLLPAFTGMFAKGNLAAKSPPTMLVMSPTRELAMQVCGVVWVWCVQVWNSQ
jgi:ATP-dependent helicase YprA (DUF1998 family)